MGAGISFDSEVSNCDSIAEALQLNNLSDNLLGKHSLGGLILTLRPFSRQWCGLGTFNMW